MKRFFNYDGAEDGELYFEESVKDLGYKISACTTAGSKDKPNEDSFSICLTDKYLWIAVFDGTTSLKSIPLLNNQTGARFASHFLKEVLVSSLEKTNKKPKEILLYINYLLLKQTSRLGGSLEDTHSLPASMATVVKVDLDKRMLEFAHAGDTYGVFFGIDGSSEVFTDDKNNKFDQEMFTLMKNISIKKGVTIKQSRQDEEVKNALYEMFIRRNNNPDSLGSGLINGDPYVEKYIQEGEYSLENIRSILLATDGLEIQGHSITDPDFRSQMYQELLTGGFQRLIALKRESEDRDPDWNYIRYKHSDDATGVMVSF
jgi:serine/threonine protein phosphatase PrpC